MKNRGVKAIVLALALFLGTSPAFADNGSDLFKTYCASCHTTSKAKIVGPGLEGINEKRSQEWLVSWIKNSQDLIAQNDAEAVAIFEEYDKMPMPPFSQLSDAEVIEILNFIDKPVDAAAPVSDVAQEAAPEVSKVSKLDKVLYGLIIAGVLLLIISFTVYRKVITLMDDHGKQSKPFWSGANPLLFLVTAMVFLTLIIFVMQRLGSASSASNFILFAVFPYSMLLIFLIGSIIRYRRTGYQVSSLSSQFLETKKLFWGSTPFHWGLLFLFFGHLSAFLIPRTILAWNGHPWRLLVLEISSFAFALCALFGITMLAYRRLTSKKLMMVTNKADLVVYAVLFVQILSGLGTAYFVRWGSSWFAGVLTPYLRSLFVFNPQIDAVSTMPIWIQIHIISAFLIVGIIPFTRFMHFLVAPIDYLWRRYQLVIWNWDRKGIRKSKLHYPGHKAKNH